MHALNIESASTPMYWRIAPADRTQAHLAPTRQRLLHIPPIPSRAASCMCFMCFPPLAFSAEPRPCSHTLSAAFLPMCSDSNEFRHAFGLHASGLHALFSDALYAAASGTAIAHTLGEVSDESDDPPDLFQKIPHSDLPEKADASSFCSAVGAQRSTPSVRHPPQPCRTASYSNSAGVDAERHAVTPTLVQEWRRAKEVHMHAPSIESTENPPRNSSAPHWRNFMNALHACSLQSDGAAMSYKHSHRLPPIPGAMHLAHACERKRKLCTHAHTADKLLRSTNAMHVAHAYPQASLKPSTSLPSMQAFKCRCCPQPLVHTGTHPFAHAWTSTSTPIPLPILTTCRSAIPPNRLSPTLRLHSYASCKALMMLDRQQRTNAVQATALETPDISS
jgi:hypothetical protein